MIEDSLIGKTALVTGASRGIGAGVARVLARQGARVALHYGGSRDAAEALAQELGDAAFPVHADMRDIASIRAMFDTVKAHFPEGLDILVANAGVGGGGASFSDTDEAAFDTLFDTNVKGLFFVLQGAIPLLKDGGSVVTTGSVAARGAAAARAAYSASKLAGHGLTLSYAQELAPRGIKVNCVAPGAVATDLIAPSRGDAFDKAVKSVTAFGRIGEPSDIANAILLLVQPEAAWITGQTIEVSGGLRI